MPHDEAAKQRTEALAAPHTNIECLIVERVPDVWCTLQPLFAWSGERDDPEKALLSLEGVPDDDDKTVDAEYQGTGNLRRNPGMLAEFHESTRATRAQATHTAARRKHH